MQLVGSHPHFVYGVLRISVSGVSVPLAASPPHHPTLSVLLLVEVGSPHCCGKVAVSYGPFSSWWALK